MTRLTREWPMKRKRREKTPVDLDKIVIKKRERKQQEEKTPDEKVLGKRSNLFNKYDQLNQNNTHCL